MAAHTTPRETSPARAGDTLQWRPAPADASNDTLSLTEALELIQPLGRRLGQSGYLYDLEVLEERLREAKAAQGPLRESVVFRVAVEGALEDPPGDDIAEIVAEVLDD